MNDSRPMNDVEQIGALLTKAGIVFEKSHTGASEGGLRTYLTITSTGGGEVVFQFSGKGDLVGVAQAPDSPKAEAGGPS